MLGDRAGGRAPENARVKKIRNPLAIAARSGTAPIAAPDGLRSSSRAAGFTLIEVLIALIVLVLGVLGAAGMTLASMRDSKQSGLRAQASALAYELGDIMRANPGQSAVFTGGTAVANAGCWTTGCAPTDMAKNDFYEWKLKLATPAGLPNASAVVCHDATNLNTFACDNNALAPLVVKLKWDEKNNAARDQTAAAAAVTTRYLSVVVQPAISP